MRSTRARALLGAKLLVTGGLLWLVFHAALAKEGAQVLLARLGGLDARFVALAALLQCGAVLLGALRWRVLLSAHGLRLRPLFLLRGYLVGRFFAAFTPSTAGLDAYRVVEVGRATGEAARAGQVVLVEKCVGVLGLALVTAVTGLAGSGLVPARSALGVSALAALGASVGLVLLARPHLLVALAGRVPGAPGAKLRAVAARLPAGGLSSRTLALTVALGLLGHLSVAATFVATGRALGVSASDGTLLVVGNAIVVATLLPVSIGGVGVREGVATLLLAHASVAPATATLVAVLGYLAGQVPAVVGGAWAMFPAPAAIADSDADADAVPALTAPQP